MTGAQRLIPNDPMADLNARIGIIGQRQEELPQVVGKLDHSADDFGQLRGYVEQIAGILADVAKEVARLMLIARSSRAGTPGDRPLSGPRPELASHLPSVSRDSLKSGRTEFRDTGRISR
jgi:hypothetical protein